MLVDFARVVLIYGVLVVQLIKQRSDLLVLVSDRLFETLVPSFFRCDIHLIRVLRLQSDGAYTTNSRRDSSVKASVLS